jgi:hypothetical protein
VVTTLEGTVTVMRTSLPEPAPLKFRDDIFVKDRIATGQDSVARILLGGKAVVTVREHSVVTITEVPGLSTIDVAAGRAAVAVAREKMRAGDIVEVKTPNAVAGIRGTVIVAEVVNSDHSVITVLKGVIDVTRLDGAHLVDRPAVVKALQRVTITTGSPISGPHTIAHDAAKRLGQEFRVAPPRSTPAAVTAVINASEVDRAARHLAAISALPTPDGGARRKVSDDDRDGVSDDTARRDADGAADKGLKLGEAKRARKASRELGVERIDGAVAAVNANEGAGAAISTVGEALKGSERGNRKHTR